MSPAITNQEPEKEARILFKTSLSVSKLSHKTILFTQSIRQINDTSSKIKMQITTNIQPSPSAWQQLQLQQHSQLPSSARAPDSAKATSITLSSNRMIAAMLIPLGPLLIMNLLLNLRSQKNLLLPLQDLLLSKLWVIMFALMRLMISAIPQAQMDSTSVVRSQILATD